MKFFEEMYAEDNTIKNSINAVIQEIDRKNRRLVGVANELKTYKKALDKACEQLEEFTLQLYDKGIGFKPCIMKKEIWKKYYLESEKQCD